MPIYAYKCSACGHAKDVLQKISDTPLSVCPACGAQAFSKQVTAAGFQLKGSGWYVTDFRGGSNAGAADSNKADAAKTDTGKTDAAKTDAAKTDAGKSGGTSAPAEPAGTSSTKSDAPSAAAGGCGAGCACH